MKPTSHNILIEARSWIGTPYHHQAALKGVGCDCLGLVLGIWREFYGQFPEQIPPYSPIWLEAGGGEALAEAAGRHLSAISLENPAPGDVLLFRWQTNYPAKHLGILTDNNSFIHAYEGAGVCDSPLVNWWRQRIAFAFSFPCQ